MAWGLFLLALQGMEGEQVTIALVTAIATASIPFPSAAQVAMDTIQII